MLPQNRDASYNQWRNSVFEALYEAGMESVADDWLKCATSFATFEVSTNDKKLADSVRSVYVCSHDPSHYAKAVCFTCHCRVCPDCARRETARLLARYMPTVETLAKKDSRRFAFRHIVLTTPLELEDSNISYHLNRLMAAVPKLFDNLLPADWRKKQGYIVTAEFGSTGHKLHFHVFFYGQYIPQNALSHEWERVTGSLASVVFIRRIAFSDATESLSEQVKYVTKFWSRDEQGEVAYFEPRLVPVLLNALAGIRRVRSYGLFYGIKEQESESLCPHCNAPVNRWTAGDWRIYAETGWLPDEALLNLKHGNNSSSEPSSKDKSPPEQVPKQRSYLK